MTVGFGARGAATVGHIAKTTASQTMRVITSIFVPAPKTQSTVRLIRQYSGDLLRREHPPPTASRAAPTALQMPHVQPFALSLSAMISQYFISVDASRTCAHPSRSSACPRRTAGSVGDEIADVIASAYLSAV